MFDKLMVVAHPDDESLFGGAQLILEHDWTVVCVTNSSNRIRHEEFINVMQATGSRFEIWDHYDEKHTPFNEAKLRADLGRVVAGNWSKIVTHSSKGEYGHLHHIQIHRVMKELVPNLWCFSCDGPIPLPEDIWQRKLDLIGMYKSQKRICDENIPNVRNERVVQVNLKLL